MVWIVVEMSFIRNINNHLRNCTGDNGSDRLVKRSNGEGVQTKDNFQIFFGDHIAQNDTSQDFFETVSFVEALGHRIKKQLPKCPDT